ncbi:hypothetical protein [Buttiauxella noackiae]|uniref:hypothetical protein n=1 Tax=Buttiauxella noackiae TaxID=82992 RepID=UPI0005573991|nr:hypothetical protein [Buttiauxella noackiae]
MKSLIFMQCIMQYNMMTFSVLLILSSFNLKAERLEMVDNKYYIITISCYEQNECAYNKVDNIPIVVTIINISDAGFYLPLKFIEKTGPGVHLIDLNSNKRMPLMSNLASWDLKKELVYVPKEGKVSLKWTILAQEVAPFVQDGIVNVSAKFSIRTKLFNADKNELGEFIYYSQLIIKGNGLDGN